MPKTLQMQDLKYFLLIGSILIPALCFCQTFPEFKKTDNGLIIYSRIITNDSLTQRQLYNKVKDIGASSYQSAEAIQTDNPNDYVVYKGYMPEFNLNALTKFYIKDGKVKIEITGITQIKGGQERPVEYLMNKEYQEWKERTVKGKKYNIDYWINLDKYMNAILDYMEKELKKKVDF